jgi:hypothetical protein
MNPFPILLPELWALIRGHLCTHWDARWRVALQRVCKAAHALDPGLILAAGWRDEMALLDSNTPHLGLRYQRYAMLLEMMTEMHACRLWDEPWFIEPDVVHVYLYKDTGKRCYVRAAFDLSVDCSLYVDYDPARKKKNKPNEPHGMPWDCEVWVRANDDTSHSSYPRHFATLQALIQSVPMLGRAVSPELIRLWGSRGKLGNLFLE